MTICGKVCELLHKLALLAATPVIFYSLSRICLGRAGKSYGLLVNFRACPSGFLASLEQGMDSDFMNVGVTVTGGTLKNIEWTLIYFLYVAIV